MGSFPSVTDFLKTFFQERSVMLNVKKAPLKRTIYDDTIKKMKALNTHDVAYNRIIDIYAGMVNQYYTILYEWEKEGRPISTDSAAGSAKKHPALDQLEKLRKDILAYSDKLMLNPKSAKDIEAKQQNELSPFQKFLQGSGDG